MAFKVGYNYRMGTVEFVPLDHYYRLTRLWWLIALGMFFGGAAGFIFSRAHPPIYEAITSIYVAIDLENLPLQDIPKDQLQYNEDLALSVADWAFRSPDVQAMVLVEAKAQNLPVKADQIAENYTVQRRHAFWELHFRDPDPATAQAIANIWSEITYQALISWQAAGNIESYLTFQTPIQAPPPTEPIAYNLYQLILAGSLIGLVGGIVLANIFSR